MGGVSLSKAGVGRCSKENSFTHPTFNESLVLSYSPFLEKFVLVAPCLFSLPLCAFLSHFFVFLKLPQLRILACESI